MKTLIKLLFLFLSLAFTQALAAKELTPESLSDEQSEQIVLCAHQSQKFNSGLGALYDFYEKYYDRFSEFEKKLIIEGKLDAKKSFNFNEVGKRGGYMDAEEGPLTPTKKDKYIVNTVGKRGGYMDAEEGPLTPTKKDKRMVNIVSDMSSMPLVKQTLVRQLFVGR